MKKLALIFVILAASLYAGPISTPTPVKGAVTADMSGNVLWPTNIIIIGNATIGTNLTVSGSSSFKTNVVVAGSLTVTNGVYSSLTMTNSTKLNDGTMNGTNGVYFYRPGNGSNYWFLLP